MKLLDYSGLQRFLNKVKTLLDSKSNTGHTHTVSDVSGLSTVATSGDYGDLSNTPTIPTVNNATLTIQKNGSTVKTFTANASSNVTANITVPTKTSDLTNDSGFLTSHNPIDSALSSTSTNAVQNKVVNDALTGKSDTGHSHTVSDISDFPTLSTVATSGSYNDLSNKPTIPTVNNKTLTIQKNGTNVATFTANSSSNVTANITVPTAVSELTNDSGYLTSASNLDSSKLTGTIDIARLPKGALERLVTVADQTARFALTTSDIQLGDTVKQLDTGVMYIVTDETKLNSADGYTEYTAGSATSVPWSGVTGKPSDFTPSSHTHGSITNDGKLGTASRALVTDSSKKIAVSSVTSTELGYLSGVTSAVQTQLNGKSNTGHTHVTSEVTDLLNSQHTWSAQQSYSADLNLNYSSTDVDDILDTVAGSYTAEDFLAQNNVWTGTNTFSKAVGFTKVNDTTLYTQNSRAELGETNLSGDTYTQISFVDKNGDNFGYLRQTYYADGDNRFSIYVRNKFTSGAPDTSGTVDYAYFGLRLNEDNSKEGVLRGTFRPYDNGSYSLGSSSYQWKSVYAQTYYYNGTAFGDIVTHNASEFSVSGHTHSASDITSGLAAVATSGSYNDLSNKPTIPTVNNATLTIQKNGTTVKTFTANASSNVTANITVPIKTSELTNDSHQTITVGTDTTSTASPAHGDTFTCIDSVTRDSNGHVTKVNTKTITLPSDNNTDTLVAQNYSTANNSYPVVFSNVAGVSSTSNRGNKGTIVNNAIYANPSTGSLYATKLYSGGNEVLTSHQSLSNYSTLANTVKSISISGKTITVTPGSGSAYTLTTQDTVYTHPTTSGNKHIPSGGSSGQFLGWDSDGTAKWVNNPNTDTKVTQNVSTANASYPILCCPTAEASANQGAKTSIFGSGVKINPYYSQLFAGNYTANGADGLRIRQAGSGKYSAIFRNDGAGTYILVTNENDPDGSWNDFRPLHINNATGICDITGNVSGSSGSCTGNAATSSGLLSNTGIVQNGITYTGGSYYIGTSDGQLYKGSSNNAALISAPENGTFWTETSGNVQNLRFSWSSDGKYLHDIFVSPNNNYIWHRDVVAGTARGWRRVVEENVSGLTNQTWSINIGGSAASATNDGSGNVISTTYGKLASANTWSAVNTFSAGNLKLKSAYQEIGVTPANNTVQYFEFNDKNNVQHGAICLRNYNTGASEIQMYITDKFKNGAKDPTGTSDSTFLSFGFKANGSKFLTFSGQLHNSLIPDANNTYDLGSDSHRWKSINGVNPGALFLPKISSKVSLSERLTDLTGQTSLYYTPPYNGWISIVTDNTSSSNFIRCTYDNILAKADGNGKQSGMSILCPVLAGVQVAIYVKCVTLTSAFFYPSLGDVNSTT